MQRFLAGVGRALIFRGDDLIGVAKVLTESTFNFSISGEEIRGGMGNGLYGKYFHDSALNVTLTDAMFNLEYLAASIGANVQMGGLAISEEQVQANVGGTVTVANVPVPMNGALIGWYKKPTDELWSIGNFENQTMTIPAAQANEVFCVKYFYQNENARSIVVKAQYVPAELHVVIINDLYNGDIANNASETTKVGRLITDIPRLQLDGNQTLSLDASSAATVSLTGSALAVSTGDSCEEDTYYGTMTEEIFGQTWQDNVVALAIENSEMALSADESEALIVRVVYGNGMASERKANSNFTFVSNAPSTASVDSDTGIVTGGSTQGTAIITVTLTGHPNVSAGKAVVEVTN